VNSVDPAARCVVVLVTVTTPETLYRFIYRHTVYRSPSTNTLNIDSVFCWHTCQQHDTSYAIEDYKETHTTSREKRCELLIQGAPRRVSNNRWAKTKTGMHRLGELLFDTRNIRYKQTYVLWPTVDRGVARSKKCGVDTHGECADRPPNPPPE